MKNKRYLVSLIALLLILLLGFWSSKYSLKSTERKVISILCDSGLKYRIIEQTDSALLSDEVNDLGIKPSSLMGGMDCLPSTAQERDSDLFVSEAYTILPFVNSVYCFVGVPGAYSSSEIYFIAIFGWVELLHEEPIFMQ